MKKMVFKYSKAMQNYCFPIGKAMNPNRTGRPDYFVAQM